jgi:hypothetical protein
MSISLEIVTNFLTLLDEEHKYEEAANFLDDDAFKFVSPKASFNTKADWLQRFPNFHKDPPTFDSPEPGAHDKQVTRKGKRKISLFTVNLLETYELNDEGKIVRISASKA